MPGEGAGVGFFARASLYCVLGVVAGVASSLGAVGLVEGDFLLSGALYVGGLGGVFLAITLAKEEVGLDDV